MKFLLIALGGAAGSLLRYCCQQFINTINFPYGTLLANLGGCLLIGLFWAWATKNSFTEPTRLLLITGFCGGFTTFSAFTQESIQMMLENRWVSFFSYISISVFGGLLATFAGYKLIA